MKTNISKPFLKWVGGKTQLLDQLDEYLPKLIFEKPFTYIEPFVGGGAMFFHMLNQFKNIKRAIINDINEDLIKAYFCIKNDPDKLIEGLSKIEKKYFEIGDELRQEFYLSIRTKFNTKRNDDITNTIYMMFLNRTCFNGLYRVNRKGEFNVPFGRYKKPTICNEKTIIADSVALKSIDLVITSGDFKDTKKFVSTNELTFFYFDPPYRPLDTTSSFTSYAKGDFNDDDQIDLANFCKQLDREKCLWMLSNSDGTSKNPNDHFLEDLYHDFKINRVSASRSINANPTKRGKLTELLVYNGYKIRPNNTFDQL